MKIYLVAAGFMALLVCPALAAEEFFVVQNPETKNCKVSNKKDDGENVLIGTTGYATADEAKAAKAAATECGEGKTRIKRPGIGRTLIVEYNSFRRSGSNVHMEPRSLAGVFVCVNVPSF